MNKIYLEMWINSGKKRGYPHLFLKISTYGDRIRFYPLIQEFKILYRVKKLLKKDIGLRYYIIDLCASK